MGVGEEVVVEVGDVRFLVLLLLLLPVLLPVGREVRTEGDGVLGLLLVPVLLFTTYKVSLLCCNDIFKLSNIQG